MTALIRSEALRLRTLRSTWAVLATVLAVGVAIAGGGMADAGGKDMTTPGQLREPVMVGVGLLAAVILAGFAAIHAGGEYRYQTITQRLLGAPDRTRALAAKLVVHAGLAGILGAVGLAAGLALAEPLARAQDVTLDLSAGAVGGLAGGVVLGAALFAMLGTAVGVIARSQSAGVVAVVGAFGIERLLSAFAPGAAGYLPYGALQSLLQLGGAPLAPGRAAVALALATAALTTLAAWLLLRRDVT
jgi:ABC-2 type transport system permease protein